MNKKNNRKGFTTVELVIVIAVIAILATALIPTFGGLINSANETKYMQEARQIYNDFMLEHAADAADATYYIKTTGNTYYKVNAGSFSSEPETLGENVTEPTDYPIVSRGATGLECNCKGVDGGEACSVCGKKAN